MAASAKRKKEKKKDFQKPKLKVGKTKPKAANFTDTSFQAKSIILSTQSISTTAPSTTSQFNHHLSLLTHRSETQRRDSLAYLTSVVSSYNDASALPQPTAVIIPKIQPLIVDGSNGVRQQLLKLLRSLPPSEVRTHTEQLLLYARAGMTHLASEIRSSAIDVLEWLLEIGPEEVVSCPGGWIKTLRCFLGVLGWHVDSSDAWKASYAKPGSEGKTRVKQVNALAALIKAGLGPAEVNNTKNTREIGEATVFPLRHVQHHLVPSHPNAYGYLNLFGIPRHDDNDMYTDKGERQTAFRRIAQGAIEKGLEQALKEGGETGRSAAWLRKAADEGMKDAADEDIP